jgi:hypothetical protein
MRLHALALLDRARIEFGGLHSHDALLLLPPAEECHARSCGGGVRAHTDPKPARYDTKLCPHNVRQRTHLEDIAMVASDRMSATSAFGVVTQADRVTD